MNSIRIIFVSLFLLPSSLGFAQQAATDNAKATTYNHVISFAPIQITENGPGLAVSYEKFLDKTGLVSLYVPLMLTYNMAEDKVNGNPRMDPMVYVQPGIKVYTNMNSEKHGKLSLGPNLVLGMGSGRTSHVFSEVGTSQPYLKRNRFMLGAMGTIGGNLFIGKYLYVGFDFSMGCAYVNMYDGENIGLKPLTQTSFRIGFWK